MAARRAALESRRRLLANLIESMAPESFRVLMAQQHERNEFCVMCGRDWTKGPAEERLPPSAWETVGG